MEDASQILHYRLARTVVTIDGTVTIDTAPTGERVAVRSSQVAIGTEADPDEAYRQEVVLEERWWRERSFDLELAPDERLAGATDTTTGLGAEIAGAAISVATLAARAAPAVLTFAFVPQEVRGPVAIEDVLRQEDPTLADRRAAFRASIDTLQQALATLTADAAADDAPPTTADRLKTLQAALAAARAEAALLDADFDAWRARRFPTWAQKLTYTVGTDQLPIRPAAEDRIELGPDDLQGDLADAARTLGTVVVRIGDADPSPHTATVEESGLLYRVPRRARLATYETEDGGGYQLRTVTPAWIVDSWSQVDVIPLRSAVFSKHGVTAEFGAAGTLVHVGNDQTGAGKAISTALGAAGGEVTGALDQAAKIRAALAPGDPALEALKAEVERKELEARKATAIKTISQAARG